MTLDRFTWLLDTFGADFRRWPEKERLEAQTMSETVPLARERWEKAGKLDSLFKEDRARLEGACRKDRLAITNAAILRMRFRTRLDWRWLFSKPVGAALAATILAGWIAGSAVEPWFSSTPSKGLPAVAFLLSYDGADFGDPL